MAKASAELPLSCQCGIVGARVLDAEPRSGDHIVCYCHDCRDFVRLLHKEDHILDRLGGTALFNFRFSRFALDRGADSLACLHMTDKPVLRWYAECCGTPMFNSYANARIPFFDVILANSTDRNAREALGDSVGNLFTTSATGDASHLAAMSLSGLVLKVAPRVIRETLNGGRRRNPLFDADTLEPIARPRRLTASERSMLGRE